MANIKSAKKRIKTNEKARLRNKTQKSAMRTAIKKLETAVSGKDRNKELEITLYNDVSKKVDKAVSKGIVHKNYAARQKSRLMKKINQA
ncbi:MAG: 30S ribosomal protein S20 [Mycoplasmatales bacterium]